MESRHGHIELAEAYGSSALVVCALQLLSDDSVQGTVFCTDEVMRPGDGHAFMDLPLQWEDGQKARNEICE